MVEKFAFSILDLYSNNCAKEKNTELFDLEDIYLKLFIAWPNYNLLTEAGF